VTPAHLTILRAIAAHQPILKEDLYRILSIHINKYGILDTLRDEGYIQFERKRGPVWLTVKGRDET